MNPWLNHNRSFTAFPLAAPARSLQHNHARYDAFGRRARKAIGTNTTDYLYDLSNNIFAIFTPGCGGTGCWTAGAIYLNGQFFTQYYNGTTYFVTADHLGSSRLLTDLSQSVYDSFDYLPFGEQIAGGSGTNLKFTSLENDSETNLDHAQFRQYSSQLGRWMRPDPAGLAAVDPTSPQSWNRYSYVVNNPLSYIDPFGLDCDPELPASVNTVSGCSDGSNEPGGGDGGACTINGLDAPCSVALGLLGMGAANPSGTGGPGFAVLAGGFGALTTGQCVSSYVGTNIGAGGAADSSNCNLYTEILGTLPIAATSSRPPPKGAT